MYVILYKVLEKNTKSNVGKNNVEKMYIFHKKYRFFRRKKYTKMMRFF